MQGVIYFTLIAFTLSILIVILNTKLNHKNEKEQIISKMLPGYNCGACGYASCSMMAKEIIIKKYFKDLYKSLGIYLPLITTNCAVFGIILSNIKMEYNLITSVVNSLGASLGFVLVIYIFSLIREKIENNDIVKPLKGIPIALITAGIMAIIFARLV